MALATCFAAGCGGDDESPGAVDSGADAMRDAGVPPLDSGILPGDAGDRDAVATPDTSLPPGTCPGTSLAPGDHTFDLDFDGRTRSFLLHVPAGYDGTMAAALVLNFHGYTQDAAQQVSLTGMNDEADERGFIAVHPDGIGSLGSFNGGECCGTAESMDADDVGLARAIVADVSGRACVDPRRVYATGMSNGGFMAYRLACEASDLFAAIAPVAAVLGLPDEQCTPSRPVPVMEFHGTSDFIVPYDGGGFSDYRSVDDTIASWRTINGCTGDPTVTFDMGDTTCQTWSACEAGAEVILCTIEDGGHLWPGGVGGLGSDASIVATDAMWDFFDRHSLP
ncbi:MAG: prolyl oligopeptidase family serine peptidase [Deltaproteobacteria bacterium]|nr:prolyl oligopeptidase family serine peptidase [Deltaproteobacteria bacterium]